MRALLAALVLAALPGMAAAQLPEGACYVTGAGQTSRPSTGGVQALAIEFRALTGADRLGKGYWRHLRISARMSAQGQAARDGVAGLLLSATADCRTETLTCFSDDDASQLSVEVINADTILVRTSGFAVAEYGDGTGLSDLADRRGQETRYLLTRWDTASCRPD